MDLNFGGAYMCSDWTFSARTTDLLENIRLSYVHHVAPDLDVCVLAVILSIIVYLDCAVKGLSIRRCDFFI